MVNINKKNATYRVFPTGGVVPPQQAKNLLILPHLEKFHQSVDLPPPNFYSLLTKSNSPLPQLIKNFQVIT